MDETFGPLRVERRSLESLLNPMKWVNDEVISKYTELMAIRENSGGHNLLKCYFFNAWFHVSRLKIHLLKNCEIECDGFTVSIDQECPQQPNSFDCGVYLMKFMECLSRGDIFDFNSGPMNFEQKKLVAQLMLGKMITPQ
ncbi:uncharacterized protein LOC131218911 isoform X2 [Magnolia sinica]|uniref:uncharacterized protein LOC131218911 isoform X2 n=1 Tax=Magnolia sinica TaxID=86752 RepID=UPI002657FE96|nr:uncharacterized protein LOC131218911 isoform X2 [Magnolia sinica]